MVHITQGLAETLLRFAAERDPDEVTVAVAVTPSERLAETSLPDGTPIFTHFYMPEAGGSVRAVFGIDLGTPAGQTQGRFVSHPDGRLGVSKRDDLHEVVFVAVPPWEQSDLAVFDRRGKRQELAVVDAEPPEESVTF